MSTRIQRRGGTTSAHSTFTGASREITVDTDKNTAVVHDGVTAGGHPLAKSSELTAGLSGKADASHTHSIDNVTGLQTELDGKGVDLTSVQSFTEAEKGQARANIGGGVLAGFRNKIINGNFDIWQRFTSVATWVAPISNYYVADRWRFTSGGTGGAGSVSRQAFTPGQTDVPGNPDYFCRWQITSAASGQTTGSCYVEQPIEFVSTLAGKKATATVYLKGTGTLPKAYLVQGFGSGGSSDVVTDLDTNIVLGAGWTRYDFVVDVPSISGKTIGANNYVALGFMVPINTTYTLDMARVSFVPEDASAEDDPSANVDPSVELWRSQRFYSRMQVGFNVYATASTQDHEQRQFLPRQMRGTPAVSVSGATNSNVALLSVGRIDATGFGLALRSTGVGSMYSLDGIATADAEI